MATFADEAEVRLRFQLNDTALTPSVLIVRSLADAHEEVVRGIDAACIGESVPEGVVAGEALLAGARVLRALASKDALEQRQITVGGQRIEAGKRFASLMALSELAERAAWQTLESFAAPAAMRPPVAVTDTLAVLGEV